jgi:hypothetical protein
MQSMPELNSIYSKRSNGLQQVIFALPVWAAGRLMRTEPQRLPAMEEKLFGSRPAKEILIT